MSDPSDYPAITAKVGGRLRRLVTVRQWRSAIASRDIDRDSEISYEPDEGVKDTIKAGACPELFELFDDILGPAIEEPVAPTIIPINAPEPSDPLPLATARDQPRDQPPAARIKAAEPAAANTTTTARPDKTSTKAEDPKVANAASVPRTDFDNLGESGKVLLGCMAVCALAIVGLIMLLVGWIGSDPEEAAPQEVVAVDAMPLPSPEMTEVPMVEPSELPPEPEVSPTSAERNPRIPPRLDRRGRPTQEATPVAVPTDRTPAPVIKEEVSQARSAAPRNQQRWAARIANDYPARAVRNEEEGQVQLRVTVNADGRVQSCSVTSSSGSATLDEAACDGMDRHARFDPALDDRGNPITGSYSTTIVYQLN